MTKLLTGTLLAAALMTGSAAAQEAQEPPKPAENQAATQDTGQSADRAERTGMSEADMVASQKKVMKALTEAGLKDVRIMDAAYLVQAVTPDDEQVMMVVNSAGMPIRTGDTSGPAPSAN